MSQIQTKFYFLICPRDGEGEVIEDATVSIQDLVPKDILTQITEDGEVNLIDADYNVSIDQVDQEKNTGVVTITYNTSEGKKSLTYKLDFNSCNVFKDDKYVIAFGIGDFELPTEEDEDLRGIYIRNAERIKKLTNLNSLEVVSKKFPAQMDYEPGM